MPPHDGDSPGQDSQPGGLTPALECGLSQPEVNTLRNSEITQLLTNAVPLTSTTVALSTTLRSADFTSHFLACLRAPPKYSSFYLRRSLRRGQPPSLFKTEQMKKITHFLYPFLFQCTHRAPRFHYHELGFYKHGCTWTTVVRCLLYS